MKQRLASPGALIDLARIPALVGISAATDTLTIKAATTYFDIAPARTLAEQFPRLRASLV